MSSLYSSPELVAQIRELQHVLRTGASIEEPRPSGPVAFRKVSSVTTREPIEQSACTLDSNLQTETCYTLSSEAGSNVEDSGETAALEGAARSHRRRLAGDGAVGSAQVPGERSPGEGS